MGVVLLFHPACDPRKGTPSQRNFHTLEITHVYNGKANM